MLISIKTLQDDRFLRPLQNIGGLFFEDSTIGFEQEEANLIVDIHIEDNVKASARLLAQEMCMKKHSRKIYLLSQMKKSV